MFVEKIAKSMIGEIMNKQAVFGSLVLLLVVLVIGMFVAGSMNSSLEQTSQPTYTSAPAPVYYCGDAMCSVGESSLTCSSDCGISVIETPNPFEVTPIVLPASEPNQ